MDERRKEERKKLMAFTPVYDAQLWKILGYLGDLTMQGAMVIGEHALPVGTRLSLAIEFPGELEGISSRRTIIPAHVARCIQDKGPHSFMIGFEFTEMDAEAVKLIQALLNRYHFRYQVDSTN